MTIPSITQFTTAGSQLAFQQALDQLLQYVATLSLNANLANNTDPAKGSALVGHESQTLRAYLLALDAQVQAATAGAGAGVVGKSTRALLDADLAHADGTVGYVTNDTTPENNTTYLKSGASGSGSWVISSASVLDVYESYVRATMMDESYDRADMPMAIVDAATNIVAYLNENFDLIMQGVNVTRSAMNTESWFPSFVTEYDISGYQWVLTDSTLGLLLAIADDGELVLLGQRISTMFDPLSDHAQWVHGFNTIHMWGDSLTHAGGGVPSQLSTLLGRTVEELGLGGQITTQIAARQGGVPTLLTLSGNTIPASGAVAVTVLSSNILTNASTAALSITGTLYGIHGTLNKDAADAYTFTRTTAGTATEIDPACPFIPDTVNRDFGINIIWAGSNNVLDPVTVKSDIARMVAHMKVQDKKFLILSPLRNEVYINTHPSYAAIQQLSTDLKIEYGDRYVDVQRLLIRNYDPLQPQDVIDFGNDVTPTSLRIDTIHLTTVGYGLIAARLNEIITQKGW